MKRRVALKSGLAFGAGVLILRRAEAQGATLNLYSARHYNTDEALYGNFADLSGVKINRIDAEPDPLVERLRAEGDKSPCDVFITTDAGRIERARQMGLLQAVSSEVLSQGGAGASARSGQQLVRLLQARARDPLQQGEGAPPPTRPRPTKTWPTPSGRASC